MTKLDDILLIEDIDLRDNLLKEYIKINPNDETANFFLFVSCIKNKEYYKACQYLEKMIKSKKYEYDYNTYLVLLYDLLNINVDLSTLDKRDLLIPFGDIRFENQSKNNYVRKLIYEGGYFKAKKVSRTLYGKTPQEYVIGKLINANCSKIKNSFLTCIENGLYEDSLNYINYFTDDYKDSLYYAVYILIQQQKGRILTDEEIDKIKVSLFNYSDIMETIIIAMNKENELNRTVYYDNNTTYFHAYIESIYETFFSRKETSELVKGYLESYNKLEYYPFLMKIYDYFTYDETIFFDYLYNFLYGIDKTWLINKYEETNDSIYKELIDMLPDKEYNEIDDTIDNESELVKRIKTTLNM